MNDEVDEDEDENKWLCKIFAAVSFSRLRWNLCKKLGQSGYLWRYTLKIFVYKYVLQQIDLCTNLRTNGFGWFLHRRRRWRRGLCEKSGQAESSRTEGKEGCVTKFQIYGESKYEILLSGKYLFRKVNDDRQWQWPLGSQGGHPGPPGSTNTGDTLHLAALWSLIILYYTPPSSSSGSSLLS